MCMLLEKQKKSSENVQRIAEFLVSKEQSKTKFKMWTVFYKQRS